jgi:hypothetical protein
MKWTFLKATGLMMLIFFGYAMFGSLIAVNGWATIPFTVIGAVGAWLFLKK